MEVERGTAQGAGICGVILVVCGVASSISGFIWVGIHGFGGYGIWSGFGLLVGGILGVLVWWKRNKGVLVGFLVVTIIMIFVASGQAITSGVFYGIFKAFVDPGRCYKYRGQCVCNHGFGNNYYNESFCGQWETLVNSLLAITFFNVIGALVCFVGSIFGCMGACCAANQRQPGAVVLQQPTVAVTTIQHHGFVAQQQPGYIQQPGYAPQQQLGYVQQPGYVPQKQPGYAPQQQPGYVQQPGYAPQQQPGYVQQPGYAPQSAGPPPQYSEKQ